MLEMLRLPLPVFINVTGSGALVVPTICGDKVREGGDRDTIGIGVNPVPVKETRTLVPLVPLTVRSPALGPSVAGVNEMLKPHELPVGTPGALPGAPMIGHALVSEKSDVV